MASQDHIRNPIEWGWDQISLAALTVGSLGRSLRGSEESQHAAAARGGPDQDRRPQGRLDERPRRFRGVSNRRDLPLPHLPGGRHRAGVADLRP